MSSTASTRVVASQVAEYAGKHVRVVGAVAAIDDKVVTLKDEQGVRSPASALGSHSPPSTKRLLTPRLSSPPHRHLQRAGTAIRVMCSGAPRFNTGTVEVIGTAGDDGSVAEMFTTQFADGFDLGMYREAVMQTQRFQNLYPIQAA